MNKQASPNKGASIHRTSAASAKARRSLAPAPARQARRSVPDIRAGTSVFLGLDVHAKQITVVRQIDRSLPQPAQRFSPEDFLGWVAKMTAAGAEVKSCYEAGCFGYVLHRQLAALGVTNLVVAPQVWDGAVKTDKRDARELCLRLDRWHAGNTRSFSVVRVPTLEEEERRAAGRHRERLLKERTRLEKRGASLMLQAGIRAGKYWWKPAAWAALSPQLPAFLVQIIGQWREQILQYEALQSAARKELEAQAQKSHPSLPGGVGALTWRLLSGEIQTWSRFTNRRQIGSYTGLCPGEDSSGESRRQRGISRHGNPRVRALLIEAVWRLTRYEKNWRGFLKFPALLNKSAGSRLRRKQATAAARLLAIDLWRLETGRTTAARLGLRQDFTKAGCVTPRQHHETPQQPAAP